MTITTKEAKGAKGMIIRVLDNNGTDTHVFRVYDENHNFIDYDIIHYDLAVEVLDDAVLCDNGKRQWIDYKEF